MVDTPGGVVGNGAKGHGPAASARVLQAVAFVLVLGASVVLLFLPLYSGSSESSDGRQLTESATLLQENSPGVLIVLAVPMLLALVPPCSPRKAWRALSVACLIALAAFVVVSMLTIGRFYLPALVVSFIALLRVPRPVPLPPGHLGG